MVVKFSACRPWYVRQVFHTTFGKELVIRQLRCGLEFREEGWRWHLESVLRDHWNPGAARLTAARSDKLTLPKIPHHP